jgi:hypothetical protein
VGAGRRERDARAARIGLTYPSGRTLAYRIDATQRRRGCAYAGPLPHASITSPLTAGRADG